MPADTSRGLVLLESLKQCAGGNATDLCLPVGEPVIAMLRVVPTCEGKLDEEDVRRLTAWRNQFVGSFLTEFEATEARTAQWLVKSVGTNPNKILFMVEDLDGNSFGYMGLDLIDWERRYGEADAIVRGGDAPGGTMTRALHALMNFARDQLGLSELGVRVRSDNTALIFYRKAGFHEVRRVPLRRVARKGEVHWIEDATGPLKEPHLVYMILP